MPGLMLEERPEMAQTVPQPPAVSGNLGGILPVRTARLILEQDEAAAKADAEEVNAQPLMGALAAHVHKCWDDARDARSGITTQMIEAARALEGQYSPSMEAQLRSQGGSTVYMMLFASKARAMKALVTDIVTGSGADKPWTMSPTPSPDLPGDVVQSIAAETMQKVAEAELAGQPMPLEQVRQAMRDARDFARNAMDEEARHRADMEERKAEDLLREGGFYAALDAFIADLAVYPLAVVKGPVVRNVGSLEWVQGPDGEFAPQVTRALRPQWERVDPMRLYPSRGARSLQDGYLVEVMDLTLDALEDMRGVPGYSDKAISAVIQENGTGRLMSEWATTTAGREDLDRPTTERPAQTVQALQFWGRVPGQALLDWGMDKKDVPSATARYDVEVWLIDRWVVRAVINTDPLAQRPYYGASFDTVPGMVWGHSLYFAMRDCEAMCNAAARALDQNMGISSGPQVWVNTDRMPNGESMDSMYPWKIWQFGNDPMGANGSPMDFFQPGSNSAELMSVFERFSTLADEYTGIPRYMTGQNAGLGGAGRTASGMSMMIGNASKTIKSLVSDLDHNLFVPLITGVHNYIMRFVDDASIKGDVRIVAHGAQSIAVREAAQVRRNEFLQATANPIDLQIVGPEGRAALLRETAKTLDMNPDQVVPPLSVIRAKQAAQAQSAQLQQMQAQSPQMPQGGDNTQLNNGAPVTQHFDPAQR